jgi:aspartyl-tRNA(Asn)/glutamyl-tRNA(Gln) amidotransferase subunit A
MLFNQITSIFKGFDAILMPVSPGTAFPIGGHKGDPVAMYLADIYTVLANLTGIPGMALPGFTHSNSMPFGLQVLTNHHQELPLHQISIYIESFIKDSIT